MNREEIGQLLTKAAMIDNRAVTPTLIQAWHEILRDLDYADATEALVYHRTNSTEYLVPAHIVAGVKRIRARRLERSITAAPPAELADDARAAQGWLNRQIAAIADGRFVNNVLGLPAGQRRPDPPPQEFAAAADGVRGDPGAASVRREALRVACPHCQARPGRPCVLAGTTSLFVSKPAHDARIEAAVHLDVRVGADADPSGPPRNDPGPSGTRT